MAGRHAQQVAEPRPESLAHRAPLAGQAVGDGPAGVLKQGEHRAGKAFSGGSVESIFLAIDDAVGVTGKLLDYQVRSITSGKDSLGEVRVVVEVDGKRYAGQAVSIDVLEASAKAYVRALNNVPRKREAGGARGDRVYL